MEAIEPYARLLLPGTCYEEFLVNFNFFDVPCLKAFVSKALGYGIIAGAVGVKLPQILKLLAAGSGAGLSMLSIYLELLAVTATAAYGYVAKFPFTAYGDSIFMLIQTAIIALLVLLFSGKKLEALGYLTIQGSVLWLLFLSGLVPFDAIWALQAANMPIAAASKMIQAVENYKNGNTGQLSAITVTLLFFGSLARIFTSVQETGDITFILSFTVATLCNAILLGQVIMYWNVDSVDKKKKKA